MAEVVEVFSWFSLLAWVLDSRPEVRDRDFAGFCGFELYLDEWTGLTWSGLG